MENFDMYISSRGYLVIPEYEIEYLIDFNESSIPSMPEVTEASVRVAGRDGDIPLKTTYEPKTFDIVCYTEDNLTVQEKLAEENKMNLFLNSIKNNTATFAMQQESKFYNVKYSGSLTTIKYPKHIKFSIPLKSSNPYAKALEKSIELGDVEEFESETIKDVGALITILGPTTNPTINLNGYEIKYENTILDGNKLEIDTNNSTVTLITNLGEKTNAMRYYNHQFPKIKNGTNTLEIISGIETSTNVKIEWYDLKL